jgi:hypothetical protein
MTLMLAAMIGLKERDEARTLATCHMRRRIHVGSGGEG